MNSKYFFSLGSLKAKPQSSFGSQIHVTSQEVPGFVSISFSLLNLKDKGFQEPIWHPNANKIGYCQQGHAFISMRTPVGEEHFTVREGDVFFIPRGYVHSIQNHTGNESTIAFAYDHIEPNVMSLPKAIYSLSENVFQATFNAKPEFLNQLKKNPQQECVKATANLLKTACISNRYKFNVQSSSTPVLTKGGYLQLATKTNLPVLEGLGILRFGLNKKGNVEPHWHTNAGELVYIVKGKTHITLLDPAGKVEVLEVKAGEGAFAPASFFHNIENIGEEEVEVIAFFSHAEPDYIGIGEAVGAFSNEVLAATFNLDEDALKEFKKPHGPLVIVPV